MSRIKQRQITVKGTRWKYTVLPEQLFLETLGENAGITNPNDKTMTFNQQGLTWGICRHELLHAYLFSAPIGSAELTGDQVEEVCAELLDTDGLQIFKQASKMYLTLLCDSGMLKDKDTDVQLAKQVSKWRIK